MEFVDIAGLVKGASKGEGRGNQFLSNIRNVGILVHVVRCFDNDDIIHVDNKLDPLSDIETSGLLKHSEVRNTLEGFGYDTVFFQVFYPWVDINDGDYYFKPEEGLDFSTAYTLVLSGTIRDEANIPMVDTQRIAFSTMEDPGLITILDAVEGTQGPHDDLPGRRIFLTFALLSRAGRGRQPGAVRAPVQSKNKMSAEVVAAQPIEKLVPQPQEATASGLWTSSASPIKLSVRSISASPLDRARVRSIGVSTGRRTRM